MARAFAFVGYVPSDGAQRVTRLRELEQLALRQGQTQIFIETPYRNPALMSALLQTLQAHTHLSISSGLTLESARAQSRLVKQWKPLNISWTTVHPWCLPLAARQGPDRPAKSGASAPLFCAFPSQCWLNSFSAGQAPASAWC